MITKICRSPNCCSFSEGSLASCCEDSYSYTLKIDVGSELTLNLWFIMKSKSFGVIALLVCYFHFAKGMVELG